MAHDKDDKFDGLEDSEYHFSDEEISYDVESDYDADSTKSAIPAPTASEQRAETFKKLAGSKRVVISAAVFVGLVFIVYKMVAGGPATPGTDITPQTVTAQQTAKNPAQSPMAQPTATMTVAAPTSTAPTATVVQTPQAQAAATMAAQQSMQPVQPVQPAPMMQNPTPATQPVVMTTTTTTTQPTTAPQPMPPTQTVAGMPAVIPVQSTVPAQSASAQILNGQVPADVQAKISNLATQGEQASAQLEAQYQQKINDYAAQNKALQEQVDTLNARVVTMESQMTQMMKGLQQQSANNAAAAPAPEAAPAPAPRADPKVSYNVQAIIPGRAWLRSDGGETLTVAEGDMIKDLGHVTKIDPYDGIVEINTGNRVVSLSYGNSG